jgi:16S rRNA (cytidine1402-2'-O)-methyltransferase
MENDLEARHAGTLYVVSTPIGNMGDFSFRAVDVLKNVSLILAEDTRHTRHLLDRYAIRTPMAAHHEHNEAKSTPGLVTRLERGDDLALVTDAGTPLLSDPGARLVRAAVDAGIRVTPVPGASALLAALVSSALHADRFTFFGFLPRRGRERDDAIDELLELRHTGVLYEAPSRIVGTLAELEARGAGDRFAAVAREMTKQFEEVRRGTVGELRAYYEGKPPKGEIVVVLAGRKPAKPSQTAVLERARALRREGASVRDTATALTQELGVARNEAYRIAREIDE